MGKMRKTPNKSEIRFQGITNYTDQKKKCQSKTIVPDIDADAVPLASLEMAKLLQSFNCGILQLRFVGFPDNKASMHATMEHLRINGPHKSKIRPIDRGGYAQIYKFATTSTQCVVLKVADYHEDDAFQGPFVESFMLRYLFRQFSLTGITPHLPMTLSSTRSLGRKQIMTLCEYAQYRSMYTFLPRMGHIVANLNNAIRTVLFQISYTLAWIQDLHPSFRHNDTTLRNILIAKGPYGGYSKYCAPDGTEFYLPNTGIRAILWDFDMSSIVGLADNARVYRFEVENPDYGISSDGDPGQDIYQLARWICGHQKNNPNLYLTDVFKDMQSIWGDDELMMSFETTSPEVRRPTKGTSLLSPMQLLSTQLFAEYRTEVSREQITHVFGSKNLSMPYLAQDEIVEMAAVNPADLPDTHRYTVPLGFGAPENIKSMILNTPAAQVYSRLYEPRDKAVPVMIDAADYQRMSKLLEKCALLVGDILSERNWSLERRTEKLSVVMNTVGMMLGFLGSIELQYLKMITLIALFLEGEPLSTDDFATDIYYYSGRAYDILEIFVSVMQYKWISMLLKSFIKFKTMQNAN
jgi:hypothetical protein